MNYAAVDLGTNSCRLLIASLDAQQRLLPIHRDIVTTRIGQGLNATGEIGLEAIRNTSSCLKRFQHKIDDYQAVACRAVGTSAIREAANQAMFLEAVSPCLHAPIDVISGTEEACLTYLGVRQGLCLPRAPLVVDSGGGSTEFMVVEDAPLIFSLKLGAVRAAEAGLGKAEIERELNVLLAYKQRLASLPLVVVGGTATTLAAVQMGMKTYDPARVHGYTLTRREVNALCHRMWNTSLKERREMAGVQAERADIIAHGALIAASIMNILEAEVMIVSESDLLEGVIWGLAGISVSCL